MNQITAYVDASNVYGSTRHEMEELRSQGGGLLESRPVHGHPHLPADSLTCKDVKRPEHTCFKAGERPAGCRRRSEQFGRRRVD